MNRATVYQHYGDRDALLLDATEDELTGLVGLLARTALGARAVGYVQRFRLSPHRAESTTGALPVPPSETFRRRALLLFVADRPPCLAGAAVGGEPGGSQRDERDEGDGDGYGRPAGEGAGEA